MFFLEDTILITKRHNICNYIENQLSVNYYIYVNENFVKL